MKSSTVKAVRYGGALLFAITLAGCGSSSEGGSFLGGLIQGGGSASNECVRDRSSCMHEGRCEQGERAYAESEAKRLNRAQLERLRRLAVK